VGADQKTTFVDPTGREATGSFEIVANHLRDLLLADARATRRKPGSGLHSVSALYGGRSEKDVRKVFVDF
jgi:hypothetical protein